MTYAFHPDTILDLQTAFSDFDVYRENPRKNSFRSWDYLFLKFKNPVILNSKTPDNLQIDLVDVIFAGDDALSKKFKLHFGEDTQLEMGLRWIGSSGSERIIKATGFAMRLSYPYHSPSTLKRETIIDLLVKADFLKPTDLSLAHLNEKNFSLTTVNNTSNNCCFFNKRPLSMTSMSHTKQYLLSHITSVKPKYRRDGETGMNPVYQAIDTMAYPLKLDQKMIWLLRSDGTIAVGSKNAYWISFGEDSLANLVPENLHRHINWDDRAGHPSLAIPEMDYDGSALYGGYICQKENHLQVFTSSGRYYRDDLTIENKKLLEAYVAFQLQQSYGEQDIIIYEGPYKDFYELSLFFANQPFPPTITERLYTTATIKETLASIPKNYALYNDNAFYNYLEALREGEDKNIERYWSSNNLKNHSLMAGKS